LDPALRAFCRAFLAEGLECGGFTDVQLSGKTPRSLLINVGAKH
jgi:hypothetical protein